MQIDGGKWVDYKIMPIFLFGGAGGARIVIYDFIMVPCSNEHALHAVEIKSLTFLT